MRLAASVRVVLLVVRAFFASRATLAAENMALRHQLYVVKRSVKRPKLRKPDRIFWVWLSRVWSNWRSALVIVQPATVTRWHRRGFRFYWRWKSRPRTGRPKANQEIRDLIRRMCQANSTWGAPRIQSELALLGYTVAQSTVAKYMVRTRKPPSPTWRAFLDNHVKDLAAIDFFTVVTWRFQILFCFLVLRHDRRKVVHFNVTTNPTAAWTAQQVIEAFPYAKYMIRDNDSIYGEEFISRVKQMGIEEVLISPYSPWQNPFVERVIGSVRRECLDHVVVLGEDHLRRLLREYFSYYHADRPHLSLDRNAPDERQVEPPEKGRVVSEPRVGGLHHRYMRAA